MATVAVKRFTATQFYIHADLTAVLQLLEYCYSSNYYTKWPFNIEDCLPIASSRDADWLLFRKPRPRWRVVHNR